jgi:hypothetical protein
VLRVLFGGEGERKARERAQGNHGKVRKCDGFRTRVLAASTKTMTKTKVFKKINNTSEDSNRSLSART